MENRKPLYENEICRKVGLMATCNSCDRIIWEDENWKERYIENGGYCKECDEEMTIPQTPIWLQNHKTV